MFLKKKNAFKLFHAENGYQHCATLRYINVLNNNNNNNTSKKICK